ncbi:hypothetical protein ACU8YB_21990 (plasmid) [Xanthomonas oryzae pv. oryzicola]|uniref:hypothetical protein n=1 Tax=Xanthomonas oryzae TaxID=347 RepID=UPI003DA029D3
MSNFFNKDSLQRYLARHVLGVEARRYIEEAALGPSRAVGRTSYPAIAGEYQSLKMGTCINVESCSCNHSLAALAKLWLHEQRHLPGMRRARPRLRLLLRLLRAALAAAASHLCASGRRIEHCRP